MMPESCSYGTNLDMPEDLGLDESFGDSLEPLAAEGFWIQIYNSLMNESVKPAGQVNLLISAEVTRRVVFITLVP